MKVYLDIKALLEDGSNLLERAKKINNGLILDKKTQTIISKLYKKYNKCS